MQVLEKLKIKLKTNDSKKFGVIILKANPTKNSFNNQILGRELHDWVAFACGKLPIKFVNFDGKQNVLSLIREHIDMSYDYTIVLISSTPLIEERVVKEIINYACIKDINLCKLPVGYVIKNEYILNVETPSIDNLYSQNLDSFYVVENKKQFNFALEVLQGRINSFHMNNGVDIKKPNSVYIEPEVDIEGGVVIYAGNSLRGSSKISENVILKENNVINNSKIGKNACISGSVVESSIIASNVYVSSFCEIHNGLIGDFSTIGAGSKICNYKIPNNSKIRANSVLGEEDDSSGRIG